MSEPQPEVGGGGPRVRPPQERFDLEPFKRRLAALAEEGALHVASWKEHYGHIDGPDVDCDACDDIFGEANALTELVTEIERLAAQLTDLRGERDTLCADRFVCGDWQMAGSERNAIADLLTDRTEAGTYAKVEGLLTELTDLRGDRDALQLERVAGAIHRSIVKDEPGRPVAAPCAISWCQYGELEQQLTDLRGERDALQGQIENVQAESGNGFRFWQQKWMEQHHRAEKAEADLVALRGAGAALPQQQVDWYERDLPPNVSSALDDVLTLVKSEAGHIAYLRDTLDNLIIAARKEADADLTRLRSRGQAANEDADEKAEPARVDGTDD